MLFENGAFNRSAIMQKALVMARREFALYRRQFPGDSAAQAWRFSMAHGLKRAWQEAKGQRADALQAAKLATPQSAADEFASAMFGAAMIDNTRQYLATHAAIEARFAA